MISPRHFLAVAVAGLLSACSSTVAVVQVEHDVGNMPDLVRYAAGGGALRVAVHGDPTGDADAPALAATVRAAMQGRNGGPATRFVAAEDPAPGVREGWRVVVTFDRDRPVALRALCRSPTGDARPGEAVALRAAFCYRETALAWVEVAVPPITNLDDPLLGRAVAAATRQLFPPYDPDRATNGGDIFD